MTDGTINTCSGNFYDSGGPGGGANSYGNNENFVFTICPENAGQLTQVTFTEWNTQVNLDQLTIYNGSDISAPVLGVFSGAAANSPSFVTATPDNVTGCLTFQWVSDASAATTGWSGVISCFEPCQTINAVLDTVSPAPNSDGYLKVCPGDEITLTGSATFSEDGTGATYEWDLGNGTIIPGNTATFSYDIPGVYIANLIIYDTNTSGDPAGCSNDNRIDQVIQVDTGFDFTGSASASPSICFGEEVTINAVATPIEYINDCAPPESGTTFLPDGNGVAYETGILVDCYDAGLSVTDMNQILNICVNMEHSYSGDLDITIISPNGQEAQLFEQAGFGTYFGGANDSGTGPGVGETYCFSMNASVLLENAPTVIAGTPANDSWQPGTYLPFQSFNNLVGSPLNGTWTIEIVDNIGIDDGYIFEWYIEFDPNLQPPEYSFTPVITGESWDADTSIISENGASIVVQPSSDGTFCYTYRVTDDFGCEYFEEICVEVYPEILVNAPDNLYTCETGATSYAFDLLSNDAVILAGNSSPGDYVITYYGSQTDADSETNALVGDLTAYMGVDDEIIYVRVEYLNTDCFETFSFTLNTIAQPVINAVDDIILCDDQGNDGVELFNLDSQTSDILDTQDPADFIVTYYLSQADADAASGELTSPYSSGNASIYVRIDDVGGAGCFIVSSAPVFDLVLLPADDSSFTLTAECNGVTAGITGALGGTFSFATAPTDGAVIDPNTGLVSNGSYATTYDVSYTTIGICPTTTTQSITTLDADDSSFVLTPNCNGATASITGLAGGTFSFAVQPIDSAVLDAATGEISNAPYGATYSVMYLSNGPCPTMTTVDVTVFDEEFATFTMTPSCDGGTATITGDTGGVFTFTTAPTDGAVIDAVTGTITLGSYSTTYDVTYTTAGPCPVNTTESVTVLDEEFSDFTMTPTCDGGTATITGDAGGVFAFVTAPTDGAVIDTTTGEVTGGVGGSTYQISYITSGPCTSVTEQSLTSILIDDASFTITPGCDGGVPVISGLAGGVFSFLVTPTDGAIIDPVTGIVSNAPFGASYTIRYDTNGPCVNFSEVTFTVYEQPLIFMPAPLDVCDDNVPDYITEFDLSVKNNEITGANPDYLVTYHFDQADADAGVGALPNPYLGQNGQVVFVRVVDATTGCYSLTTLDLVVNQAPAAFTPTSLIYCDADNDGFGTFTLSDATDQITSGDTTLVVTYHETLSNAENSANALLSPYDNIVQDLQTVYARVESSLITTGCATIVSFDLIVNPTPQLTDPTPLTQCDTDTDGFEPFNLNDKSTEILNGLDPLQYVLSFYLTQLDADSATNAISAPGFFTNTIANNQTIWVRVEDTSNGCYKLTSLELIVYALPVLVQPDPLELCDDAIADGLTVFDLTQSNNQITGGNGALEVLYYETESDAISGTNAIDPETSYTNTSISGAAANPQTVFVGVTDPVTGCVSYTTLTLRVLPNPTPGLTPEDIELCDENNPGDGIEVFDLTENEIYILNGESGVALTYYESEFDAQESQNAIVDPTQYSNTISPQTIYVRDTNIVTGCYSIVSFDLLVDPLPESTTITDYIVCELNTDQLYGFDLISKDVEILNGQDPSVFTVSYYATQGDAAAATNALLSPYNNTSNPQAIYVVITNTQTMCTVGGMSFAIEVQESAQANPDLQPLTYVICDQTDANDGFAAFDLSTMNAQVLDGQNTANYVVSYYGSQSDADAGINALDNIYQNISNPQTIYARVSNVSTTTSVCYATAPLELEVNLLPIFDLEDSYLLCENTNGTEVVGPPMMDTGLSSADYSFEWQFNSGVIAGATASSYTATQAGTYSVTVTNLTTLCDNTVQTTVISSEPPILTAEVTSMVFADNATVEATVVGNGNYELSIDNGPWTTDTIFTGLSDGIHQIWARDITGCGEVMVEVLVIGYPLFFTPNGDGYNDTWNIFSLSDQLETKIYIFDRYGKLLKEIRPQGRGWDGTYNGALMPSSDYWFTVHYLDLSTNKIKQHKAHFTLKR